MHSDDFAAPFRSSSIPKSPSHSRRLSKCVAFFQSFSGTIREGFSIVSSQKYLNDGKSRTLVYLIWSWLHWCSVGYGLKKPATVHHCRMKNVVLWRKNRLKKRRFFNVGPKRDPLMVSFLILCELSDTERIASWAD